MNRRKFVIRLGAASAGGSALIGSGAFTSVSAERDITVNVSDDSSALLELDPDSLDNSAYAIESDGSTGIDISKSASGDFSGEGVSPFALTEIEEVIEVTNQGTQEVEVEVTPLTVVDTDTSSTLMVLTVPKTDFPAVALSPGTAETYSLVVDAFPGGTSPDIEIDDTMLVSAEAT